MLILITGKNSSGKSVYAENLAVRLGRKRYYIATMQPYGEEGAARVRKHIAQRAGLDFATLERPFSVSDAVIPPDAVVLVEDVSNLLSNAVFEKGLDEVEVYKDIMALCEKARCVIAVSISEFDVDEYSEETLRYIQSLTRLNERLGSLADAAVELRDGFPVFVKGEDFCLNQCGLR